MRRFDPQEIAWLERLLVVARSGPIPAAAFLARVHFARAAGRGLILQPRGRFGYCYLKPARLAEPGADADERRQLMSLLLLLSWLRRENHIAVERDGSDDPPLVVVGEAFDAVRAERSRVVLNHDGDYSAVPHQVVSAQGDLVFEGLRLEGDAFALAHEWTRGTLHASRSLEDLWVRARSTPALAPHAEPGAVPEAAAPAPQRPEPRPDAAAGPRRGWLHRHAGVWVWGLLAFAAAGLYLGSPFEGLSDASVADAGGAGPEAGPPAVAGQGLQAQPASGPAASAPAQATRAPAGPSSAPIATGVLHGVDVSKWNGPWVDHLDRSLDGIAFVFARASDGRTPDPSFADHWSAARRHGLVRGSYHFYRVAIDPEAQVEVYLQVLGGRADESDIPPVLDFEAGSFPPGAAPSKDRVQADFLRALQLLEQRGGRTPLIYTNWDIGSQWLDDARFARYPLWIADWSQRHAPRLPSTWSDRGFRFWQRTDQYQPPSQSGLALDLDWFIGAPEELTR